MASWQTVTDEITAIADDWRADRAERQQRRQLDPADFERLRTAGFMSAPVPEEQGGLWRSLPESTRPLCTLLRTLGAADPSVALVSAMHPAVLGFWLATPDPSRAAWTEQRTAVMATAAAGVQWGTITSEPGSGGDIFKSKAKATPTEDAHALPGATYAITGDKHFGSGSGISSFMITTALPDGEDAPTVFVFDMRDRPWDGSAGVKLMAEWDGIGMAATQSHAMRFEECPAARMAWDDDVSQITLAAAPLVSCLFTAVILGVFDEAIATAKQQLAPKADGMRAYEQVEWSRAEMEHWLAVQAYEGALRTVEAGDTTQSIYAALRAKESVAELADAALGRLARVIGGGTFSRRSPFAAWGEDVRALGFLRPPWGLAFDSLFGTSFL